MIFGIFCGFSAAILNSAGYIFGARFLLHYKSAFSLTVLTSLIMLVLALPLCMCLFPYGKLASPSELLVLTAIWIFAYWLGQGSFFMTLRYFNASCLSSLLGLKIILLAVIFIFLAQEIPGMWQWIAIFMAAGAAVSFNWSGAKLTSIKGGLFLLTTLIGYSLCDIYETKIMLTVMDCGYPLMRSSIAAASLIYTALGITTLPLLFFLKLSRKQIVYAAPNAVLWISSQIMLMACFALLMPVFANVILATRGIFSVLLGALLAAVGLSKFDSNITRSQWIKRGISACAMTLAITIYSFAKAGILK